MITIEQLEAHAAVTTPSPSAVATAILVQVAENRAKRVPVGRHRPAVTR